jgi:hypothetical protein
MSPRSENGGGDSGGDSSGNESPTADQEAAGTPDPRGRYALLQLSTSNMAASTYAAHALERSCNHFCQVKQLCVASRNGKCMRLGYVKVL